VTDPDRSSIKDLKAQGIIAVLCGASDGRGRVCGRSCDDGAYPDPDGGLEADCEKHGPVVCTVDRWNATVKVGGKAVIYFHPAAPIAHRTPAS
jgi:hypothetical protein